MPRPRQPAPAVLHRSVRFWWVNQNQTFRHETQGGYLWSPKRSQGDRFNLFYDNMREVAPGDLVFSFSDTFIRAIGVVQGHCYECPKPAEFGSTGRNWNAIGWRVDVRFTELANRFRPMDHMEVLAPLLPAKYSPLRPNGYEWEPISRISGVTEAKKAVRAMMDHWITKCGLDGPDNPPYGNLAGEF